MKPLSMRSSLPRDRMSSSASRRRIAQIALITCGVLSSALYIGLNIAAPARYPGYDWISQTVSELSAIGAPSRGFWVAGGFIYTVLVVAFGLGVLWTARSAALRTAGVALVLHGAIGPFWPPMHMRGEQPTQTDLFHIVFSGIALALMLVTMWAGATALGKAFRNYTILTVICFLVFGTLTGISGPRIATNEPTPWIGLWERINIGAYMLWTMVFAWGLMRLETPDQIEAR